MITMATYLRPPKHTVIGNGKIMGIVYIINVAFICHTPSSSPLVNSALGKGSGWGGGGGGGGSILSCGDH